MQIGDKVFMNLQEAVCWLLQNNALPFQCNVNYVANTEIAKSSIINPSPAQIKVGALVLFADSKIGTVSAITSNGFMVGADYTDIQLALAYIASVDVDSNGNLTTTLSDGEVKNAGQIKQITNFSINGSQHLIANFNNGTSQDLGAIFTGNVNLSGNLVVAGTIEQQTANHTITFTPQNTLFSGKVTLIAGSYGRLEVINNVLYYVFQATYKNQGASDVTISGADYFGTSGEIPLAIAQKIYRIDGTTLDSLADTDNMVCMIEGSTAKSNSIFNAKGTTFSLYSTAIRRINANFRLPEAVTLQPNESITIYSRAFLTLL